MKQVKSFFTEFKEFLLGSTFIDVAIGLLIAGAVKDVATQFTDSFVTPIIVRLLELVGMQSTDEVVQVFGMNFKVQAFITSLISFIIIMFVAFLILKSYAKMKENFMKETEEEETEVILSNEERILAEIRDLLKDQNGEVKSTEEKEQSEKTE